MTCYTSDAELLRQAGFRLTPQRYMILEAIYHHPGYTNADEIWERVRAQAPGVDLSTVYRSLHFLKAQGMVSEIHPATGPALYAAIRERPHAHAVCQGCGTILNVDAAWLTDLVSRLAEAHGFAPDISNIEIPGRCPRCVTQKEA